MNRKPNVVFVLTDDQGYGDLRCNGNSIIKTPYIDGFSGKSIRLTNFHVGPTCSPTRASLLTGHYANSTGVWHTIGGRSLLRKNEWTLASALRDAGYRTGIFGKWHLGDEYPYRPHDRGFETSIVHGGGGIGQTPDYWGNDYFHDTYFVNGEPKKFTGYCTDVWFDEALKYIEANKDRPFFCYIPTNAPHGPFNVERKYYELYRGNVPDMRARFYGMITNIDENFGILCQKLREWGLEENTLLIFMTDNGSSTGATLDRNGFVIEGYNAGMRGLKGWPYDGAHRVPFLLRWPAGGLDHGLDHDEITASVDFMPTILDLCGIEVSPSRGFHGTSIKQLLYDDEEDWPERTLVTDSQRITNPMKWRKSSVMTNRWRLVNRRELYDIQRDPEQRHDVADEHPGIVRKLRKEYEKWWAIVSEQFDEEIPISLGAEGKKEVRLTCHDWRNENCNCPWNQSHIRSGMEANGYWEILVERSGGYRIELRRWPREIGYPLNYGFDGDDVEWRKDCIAQRFWSWYTEGKVLPLKYVKLRVGDIEYSKEILPNDSSVTFNVTLKEGQVHLQSWLADGRDLQVGAYYVYVTHV